MYIITCAIDTVCPPHHLLQNLSPDVLHVFSDLDPSGLDHEHILIHCRQRRGEDREFSGVILGHMKVTLVKNEVKQKG